MDFINDPINTMDHEKSVTQVELMATCTCSVIEVLASPDAEETNTQNVPVATNSEIENEV